MQSKRFLGMALRRKDKCLALKSFASSPEADLVCTSWMPFLILFAGFQRIKNAEEVDDVREIPERV